MLKESQLLLRAKVNTCTRHSQLEVNTGDTRQSSQEHKYAGNY